MSPVGRDRRVTGAAVTPLPIGVATGPIDVTGGPIDVAAPKAMLLRTDACSGAMGTVPWVNKGASATSDGWDGDGGREGETGRASPRPVSPGGGNPSASASSLTALVAEGNLSEGLFAVARANQASNAGGSAAPSRVARAVAGSWGPSAACAAKAKTFAPPRDSSYQ